MKLHILITLLLFQSMALASGPLCIDIFTRAKLSTEDFWERDEPFMVEAGGKKQAVSFSFDTEVAASYLLKHAEHMPEFKEIILGRILKRAEPLSLQEIAYQLQMSQGQVKAFVIRKNATPDESGRFGPREMYLTYVGQLYMDKLLIYSPAIVTFWQRYMNKTGWPVEVDIDSNMFEFRHKKYSSTPRQHKKLVEELLKFFGNSNTHFHVGIPTLIGEKKTIAIARAIEARLVLGLAQAWSGRKQEMLYWEGTMLGFLQNAWRGTILFNWAEWRLPAPTSNLEIRQWTTQSEAFELQAMAAVMAQNHRRINEEEIEWRNSDIYRNDKHIGNIIEAMVYVKHHMGRSVNPTDKSLIEQMTTLISKMDREMKRDGEVSFETKELVENFLNDNRIVNRLTPDFFLE